MILVVNIFIKCLHSKNTVILTQI